MILSESATLPTWRRLSRVCARSLGLLGTVGLFRGTIDQSVSVVNCPPAACKVTNFMATHCNMRTLHDTSARPAPPSAVSADADAPEAAHSQSPLSEVRCPVRERRTITNKGRTRASPDADSARAQAPPGRALGPAQSQTPQRRRVSFTRVPAREYYLYYNFALWGRVARRHKRGKIPDVY